MQCTIWDYLLKNIRENKFITTVFKTNRPCLLVFLRILLPLGRSHVVLLNKGSVQDGLTIESGERGDAFDGSGRCAPWRSREMACDTQLFR
jgi:hypothetical protein